MPEPSTIISTSLSVLSQVSLFIKKYWKWIAAGLFALFLLPIVIFSIAINVLFPQVSVDDFLLYKDITEDTEIEWTSLIDYDVVRLDNYLKDSVPEESVFDFLLIDFTEYEIVEVEEEITKVVDGEEVRETIVREEYNIIRELEATGYEEIKKLLESLDYDTSKSNMMVKNVIDFLDEINEKEEYEIEHFIFSNEEITEGFDDLHKEWFCALVEILPLIDPSSEFDPEEYIIPELIDNPDIPSIWPTGGRVTSEFGDRRLTHIHKGIDIANNEGTPIKSTASGQVIAVARSGNFGKRIMIYHGTDENGNTYVTVYAHLSRFGVKVGDSVSQGEIIGYMGNTGYSTGTHLHYEVRVNGVPVNPRYFLP